MDAELLNSVRQLEVASDTDVQIRCLRRIKNDTVGHGLRKELVITNGLLASLERILGGGNKASGKQQENGISQGRTPWTTENEVRLQATLIVDTLANGGPAFVSPILLSDVTIHLFDVLAPSEVSNRIITASLRALNSLATSATLTELSPSTSTPSRLAVQAFSKINCQRVISLLKYPLNTSDGKQIVHLTAGLIATACTDDLSRAALTKAGILEVLGTLLADYALHTATTSQIDSYRPSSTHLYSNSVSKILNAVSAVVKNSNYRSYRLLLVSAFRRTFNKDSSNIGYHTDKHSKQYQTRGVDATVLLPEVLSTVQKSVSFGTQQFPSLHSAYENGHSSSHAVEGFAASDPFCAWLIHLARTLETPSSRLAALRLLASVYATLGLSPVGIHHTTRIRGRERQLALLAVPIAVKLVQDAITTLNLPNDKSEDVQALREEASSVLAMLIKPNQELQKAAVEAGAVKYVSLMLRKSFDPVGIARPMWSAQQKDGVVASNVPSAQMGDSGLPPEIAHTMKARAGALKALAAIAQREDPHRKAIIDQGMINYVIDSLTTVTETAFSNLSSASVTCNFNTVPVLIAACEAATSLSRSVSLLRTSLIDAGIAKPILALLHHPDADVQVAATSVCCNLVLDFSPMRQDLVDAGAMKTLCDHARRANSALRLASLWALKHLVLNAPKEFKIEVLEEIGPGWLVQAIGGDSRAEPSPSTPLGLGSSNALGEQVDLLNAPDTPEMDLDSPDEEMSDADSDSGEPQLDTTSGMIYQTSTMRSTLKPNLNALSTLRTLRERESNPSFRTRQEDSDIQEQALDMIRNLMNGDDAAAMIDHLNTAMGLQRIFELLQAKLEPSPATASSRLSAATRNNPPAAFGRDIQGTPDAIVHSAVHILTHISAASSKHKQMLIAQKPLLRAWLPHFGHANGQIRAACVWTVINLTWVEDQSDREDARKRAMELRSVGVEDKIRALQGDGELDVRERCKIAVRQLEELLVGGGRVR